MWSRNTSSIRPGSSPTAATTSTTRHGGAHSTRPHTFRAQYSSTWRTTSPRNRQEQTDVIRYPRSNTWLRPLDGSESPTTFRSSRTTRRRGHSDRKSTRLNSSHLGISYAVFCLKKKKTEHKLHRHARSVQRDQKQRQPGVLVGTGRADPGRADTKVGL